MTLLGYCSVASPNEAMGSGAVTNAAAEGMGSGEYTTCCEVDTGALGLTALEKVANEAIGSGTLLLKRWVVVKLLRLLGSCY